MKTSWISRGLLISVLAGAVFVAACGIKPDGKYQDTSGAVTMDLNSGKANLNFGGIQMQGTYTVDGNKLTIAPAVGDKSQTIVFTINKDGSLDGPPGSQLPTLQKAK